MEVIKGKHLGPFDLMPPPPGTCKECAVKHEPEQPHNKQSLFYQYNFYNQHGRWPTWGDALAHCSKEIRYIWRKELMARGVPIEEFEIKGDSDE